MQKLMIDTGVEEYQINGGSVLRFNPSDLNLYHRFTSVAKELEEIEKEMIAQVDKVPKNTEQTATEMLSIMAQADTKAKEALNKVFGAENNFNDILQGVNVMSVAGNGERVVTNLMAALAPILENGAKRLYEDKANAAVAQAKVNRAQRHRKKES